MHVKQFLKNTPPVFICLTKWASDRIKRIMKYVVAGINAFFKSHAILSVLNSK